MSHSTPKVSVVIPTYNRGTTIRDSVGSVLRQTFTDLELIVVDDCSSDNTLDVLRDIQDPRLRIERHDVNKGSSAARNTGIRVAKAPYVAFQDSDDEWLPTKLERQVAALEAAGPKYKAVYCGMLVMGTEEILQKKGVIRPSVRYVPSAQIDVVEGDLLSSLLRYSVISTQTLMVQRDVLNAIGGFDEQLRALEDWECAIRISQTSLIAHIVDPLVIQRFSHDSITQSIDKRVNAREQIVKKHMGLLSADKQLLRSHYEVIAGGYQLTGEYARSRGWYLKALRLSPFRPKIWVNLVRSYVARGNRR